MTDPTREQIDRSSINDLLADIQQAVASGEFVMAQTDSERIEELKRELAEMRSNTVPRVLYDNLKQLRDEARAEVKVLQDRIAEVRAFAEDMKTWCSPFGISLRYAQRLLEVLDRGVKPEPVPQEWKALMPLLDEPAEHIELSRDEWEAAAKARLDELDVTYCELSRMARYGIWASHQHQALWTLIGGTLDGEGEARP